MTAHDAVVRASPAPFLTLGCTLLLSLLLALPASALSQIGEAAGEGSSPAKQGIIAVPLPPLSPGEPATAPAENPAADPAAGDPLPAPPPGSAEPGAAPASPPTPADDRPATAPATAPPPPAEDDDTASGANPVIRYDEAALPAPVRDLRQRLIEIARSGDIDALGPYLETGEEETVLSFGGVEGDPVEFLKAASADGEGLETLAILLEILEAGYVHVEPGTPEEIFVWPYFAQVSLDALTPQQQVELFEIVTAGDLQQMKDFGAYNFYRLGITPDGRLRFFVAGD